MNGIGFEEKLQSWFEFKIPKTSVSKDFILNAIATNESQTIKPSSKIVWIGSVPSFSIYTKGSEDRMKITLHDLKENVIIITDVIIGQWLEHLLPQLTLENNSVVTLAEIKEDYLEHFEDFEQFWNSYIIENLRNSGLIMI
jgi:hypothetical protein